MVLCITPEHWIVKEKNGTRNSQFGWAVTATETVIRPERFYVNAKSLLDYLAKVIGVSTQSDSLRYVGELLPDGKTVYIDLAQYEVIPYESITRDNIPQEKMTQDTMPQENIPHDRVAALVSVMPTEGQEHEQRSI